MEPFIGQIQPFGFNFPPRGWAKCDGQLLPIASYTALFSLLGTTFGGDGRTTFALPDLRGRSIVHIGSGLGLDTITWGERGGRISETLTVANLPAHSHTTVKAHTKASFTPPTGGGSLSNPSGANFSGDGSNMYSTAGTNVDMAEGNVEVQLANTGGGQSFNIRNPFLGVEMCIALTGIFPSRN